MRVGWLESFKVQFKKPYVAQTSGRRLHSVGALLNSFQILIFSAFGSLKPSKQIVIALKQCRGCSGTQTVDAATFS
jgi:hypothetical protein